MKNFKEKANQHRTFMDFMTSRADCFLVSMEIKYGWIDGFDLDNLEYIKANLVYTEYGEPDQRGTFTIPLWAFETTNAEFEARILEVKQSLAEMKLKEQEERAKKSEQSKIERIAQLKKELEDLEKP